MIEARQALESALKISAQQLDRNTIANILVEPSELRYIVHLTPFGPVDKPTVEGVVVEIEADSGAAAAVKATPAPNPIMNLTQDLRKTKIFSGLHAYQAALNAIKGYEHYDKLGRLEIRLDTDHYKVTFPDPGARAGERSADYTYQVWIDVKTMKVIKILASS